MRVSTEPQKPLSDQRTCKSVAILVERLSVKSRILHSVGYDDSTKILEIEFHSGLVYQYSGVPSKVYADLMRSGEMGKYFSEKVRTQFRTKQVVG